ncbi:hypothetical protein DV736_g2461, partial [Chaetothyriales sp. CBS 134916]
MPRHRPTTSGYARLAQDERGLADDSDNEDLSTSPLPSRYARQQPAPREGMRATAAGRPKRPPHGRHRSNSSGVDIKAINDRLEKWAQEIASKFKISSKPRADEGEQLEIHHTVFQAPNGIRPFNADDLASYTDPDRMSKAEFEALIEGVRIAIELGIHPKLISKGSSGSYFARSSSGKIVGVFKPKDEEPYASRNPKWTKWVHRNLFPWFFGRACLIPNLSYVSEAAAYVLDSQLRIGIVPYTDVVYLSSKSFYYDCWERTNAWGGKRSLPAKPGSFQVFLKGYKDATQFLREHPWPDQNNTDFQPDLERSRKRRPFAPCMPGGHESDSEDGPRISTQSPGPEQEDAFHWTPKLQKCFREELEKLVIFDYIMRNTDRGLDNWMIRIDTKFEDVAIAVNPKANGSLSTGQPTSRPVSVSPQRPESNTSRPYRRYEAMESRSDTPNPPESTTTCVVKIGAIDNSLSWPWKHPDAWRSYPFGWLFLPVSMIGQPFSKRTRDHFLPLLTSTAWWTETRAALRQVFVMDSDFKDRMFDRQMAVMKGQAWNVVETLKQADHGPLELTRRTRVCVWDDIVDVPVAIPMRVPSQELRRKQVRIEHDEMDIGASQSYPGPASTKQSAQTQDLLSSPTSELPNPSRFELTRDAKPADLSHVGEEGPISPLSTSEGHEYADAHAREARSNLSGAPNALAPRPSPKAKSRLSFEFGRSLPNKRTLSARQRSMSTRSGMRPIVYEGDDDLEGDLGYAAATDMENSKRKVIVERIETVKTRKPYFEWC